ncbi:GNAT family N-acetyltransferase [Geodermatophilus sp. TF02-6]|nr:GNAT family N-acetyltransferase [Geodermatophilus sp. TF02-6]
MGSTTVELRRSTADDVPALVALLTDDVLGRDREGADPAPYRRAFAAVDADPAQLLLTVTRGAQVVGTMQLTEIPGLSSRGATRLQVEAVRIHRDLRGTGIGTAVFGWVVDEARRRGCALVQLTTDTRRTDAHRFYERLGFVASHVGFKLQL